MRKTVRILSLTVFAALVFVFFLSDKGYITGMTVDKQSLKTGQISVENSANDLVFYNNSIRIDYNLTTGLSNYYFKNKRVAAGVFSTVKLGKSIIKSSDYTKHVFDKSNIEELHDGIGDGIKISIENVSGNMPALWQNYYIYDDKGYFLVEEEIDSSKEISTNYIAPMAIDSIQLGSSIDIGKSRDPRFLTVPFDNDKWVRYESNPLRAAKESYEVTAIFDNDSRNGLVLGSVNHDTWKTGINIQADLKNNIKKLNVYGGASNSNTRDTQPHGSVTGKTIKSPKIFVGYYTDYRDGLEEFGRVNAIISPPMKWEGGVPFGWNSWAAAGDNLNYDMIISTSDFVKGNLQNNYFSNDNVYINFDAFWDNLSESQIEAAVAHIHANNQKVGIYWTPFAYWSNNLDMPVDGTNNTYKYRDILLKDSSGKILPKLDGGYAIDPTNPGELMRINSQLKKFIDMGFDYIKLDFLGHGALEGTYYDRDITTGIEAYNYGMDYISNILDPQNVGRPFFVSLSIAPIFPSQYGDSRRISCDTFGGIGQVEYMLNSLTYGWWMNGTIYNYNDPDHMVLYKGFNTAPTNENEARSRVNASVISGTVFLNSDNFGFSQAQTRAKKYLTNKDINDLAKKGISFRPVEGNTGRKAADTFTLKDGKSMYIAVFNFSSSEGVKKELDLKRLGLDTTKNYWMRDLWSNRYIRVQGEKNPVITLNPCESTIFKVDPIP